MLGQQGDGRHVEFNGFAGIIHILITITDAKINLRQVFGLLFQSFAKSLDGQIPELLILIINSDLNPGLHCPGIIGITLRKVHVHGHGLAGFFHFFITYCNIVERILNIGLDRKFIQYLAITNNRLLKILKHKMDRSQAAKYFRHQVVLGISLGKQ